jgi:phosphatidylserine/phosphatidylglycerophosphate/cardiolipin synthase-like enzyme
LAEDVDGDAASDDDGSEAAGTEAGAGAGNTPYSSAHNPKKGLLSSFATVLFGDGGKAAREKGEARELYPRMPWHDCQVAFSGPPGRDLAAHFVEVR